MNTTRLFSGISFILVFTSYSAGFQLQEKEVIKKTVRFSNDAGRKEVVIDNVNGDIEVQGYSGQDVQMVVNKTIQGRSREKIQEAKQKVQLEISEEANSVRLYVDAPYRKNDASVNYRGWRYYGYKVNFDFKVKVPHECHLYLKTINDGEIAIREVYGDCEVKNINGGIEMLEAAGSGDVYALNGEVKVTFRKNPRSASSFGSLNGDVEVQFQPDFSADLRIKTFNGEVYTDFPTTYLAPRKPIRTRKDGLFLYKSDKAFGVRIGKGGPEIEFDAFNGNIYIVKRED
ncbi:MAG: DUF4097 domain-containing protein [bacterium]